MGNSAGKDRTVIIIGSGYAGSTIARLLDFKCKVVLVEQNDAMWHKYCTMRALVVPGWEDAALVPLDKLLKQGNLLRKEVTFVDVSAKTVTFADGTTIVGDYIVLANGGGNGNLPNGIPSGVTNSTTFKATLSQKQVLVKEADSILVVGGGPIGVELSGEIKAQYPDKKLVLVHNAPKILNSSQPPMIDRFIDKVEARLKGMGVDLKTNVKVTNLPEISQRDGFVAGSNEYFLSDGSKLSADLLIVCFSKVEKKKIVSENYLDSDGRVKVDSCLRVEGASDVFCIGDANNMAETKLGYYAGLHAELTAKNIRKLFAGSTNLTPYALSGGAKEAGNMFIPLGPHKGVSAVQTTILRDGMTRLIKGKGLFTKKVFSSVDAVAPSHLFK